MQIDPTAPGFDAGGSVVDPIALAIVGVTLVMTFVLPRRWVMFPLLATALFIPLEQRIVIGGFHFMMIRIVLLAGWIRALAMMGGEASRFRVTAVDKVFVAWALAHAATYVLLWRSSDSVVNRLGFLYDAFGAYFLFRFVWRQNEDVARTIKAAAALSVLVALSMINEQRTGRNLFAVFGGVPEYTPIREGTLRSQAAFQHPILAGCFGAALLPMCVSLWRRARRSKTVAACGLAASAVIVITSNSSTSTLACVAGVFALFLWPLRRRMRLVRWGVALALVALHLVMNGPVWALINRMSVIGGSSSWHRFYLIDQFIRRFGEWALLGTQSNAAWGLDTWDVANQYVSEGTRGGVLTLALFLALIGYGFRAAGRAREAAAHHGGLAFAQWALGAALFAHAVAFYGISYDPQTALWLYLLLAMLSSLEVHQQSEQLQPAPARRDEVLETDWVARAASRRAQVA